MIIIEPRALDLETAAGVYALGQDTLRRLMNESDFPHLRIGHRVIIPVALADAWFADRANGLPIEAP